MGKVVPVQAQPCQSTCSENGFLSRTRYMNALTFHHAHVLQLHCCVLYPEDSRPRLQNGLTTYHGAHAPASVSQSASTVPLVLLA